MTSPARNLKVFKASAGSGKTYTLAKTYIEYLLFDNQGKLRKDPSRIHEHLLAITFTNKATKEMKTRIVRELCNLKQGGGDYMGDFVNDHKVTKTQVSDAAAKALTGILMGYTNFNVRTIDSFFQGVLRNFAHELDRDYDYEVQLDAEFATRQAVNAFLHDLGTASPTGKYGNEIKWIKDYLKQQIGQSTDGADWNVFGGTNRTGLQKMAKQINDDFYRLHASAMATYLQGTGTMGKPLFDEFNQLLTKLGNAAHILYCGGLPGSLKASSVGKGFNPAQVPTSPAKFAALLGDLQIKSGLALNSMLAERPDDLKIDSLAGYGLSKIQAGNCFLKGPIQVTPQQAQAIYDMKMQVVNAYYLWQFFVKVQAKLWMVGMLGRISLKLDEFRRDNDVILLADTNEFISQVLESGVHFVYERVGTWLSNFMIDEFQDTNRSQYKNFVPLLNESLAGGNSNLIIGDVKQSIYRFRGSDPSILQSEVKNDFPRDYKEKPLDTNHRSADQIVDFNNDFFKWLIDSFTAGGLLPKLKLTYADVKQEHNNKDELHPEGKSAGLVRLHLYHSSLDDGSGVKARDHVLSILPRYILNLRDKHGFKLGDILVLINTHEEGDAVVKRILDWNAQNPGQRIGVVSEESLKLTNSPAVLLVVSVLRYIDATQYREADADAKLTEEELLRRKAQATPAELLHLKRLNDQLRYEVMHEFSKLSKKQAAKARRELTAEELGTILHDCFGHMAQLRRSSFGEQDKQYAQSIEQLLPDPVTEMVNLVGLVDKIIDYYSINSNQQETAFLIAFQDLVVEFCAQAASGGTVREFLHYWDEKKDNLSIPSSDSDEAVRVMTIHKAKGLEAPCVIIPFANWKMKNIKSGEVRWVTKQQLASLASLTQVLPEFDLLAKHDQCIPPILPLPVSELSKVAPLLGPLGKFWDGEVEDEIIDNLNKTYVAFTRPQQQLHIFTQSSTQNFKSSLTDAASSNLTSILVALAHNVKWVKPDEQPEEWLKSAESYHFGNLDENRLLFKKEQTDEALPMEGYPVHSALKQLRVKLPHVIKPESREGTALHRIMSVVLTAADEQRALLLARQRRAFSYGDYWNAQNFAQQLHRLLTGEVTREWFQTGNRVFTERPILNAVHDETRRPDRVVVTPDGRTLVIDYKFGAEGTGNTADDEKALDCYRSEVSAYARLLSQAGFQHVEAYLWFARTAQVVEVPLEKE